MTVGAGRCDAIMGVPDGFEKLLTTIPWYHARFTFVTHANEQPPRSLHDPKLRGKSIGVPETGDGETPPALVLSRGPYARNLHPFSILSPRELVNAVREGTVDMAIVWEPYARWWAPKEGLRVHALPAKEGGIPLGFGIAVGVRKGNSELQARLNQAIDRQAPAIRAALAHWLGSEEKP
jgi:mxaJ protein